MHSITPGMAATVSIKLNRSGDADESLSLPVSALFADEQGKDNVWVVDPETIIPMQTLHPATYFLRVAIGSNVVKTFKINKK